MLTKSIYKELKSKFINSNNLRLKSVEDGLLRTGPEFVRIGVTRKCNFNCLTCWNYSPLLKRGKSKKWKKVEINKNLVFETINQLAEMQCIKVLFSGDGEPFAHPYMMNFIKRTVEKKILVYIQTNLSLVDDPYRLANYLRPKLDLVCVHLSAASPDVYVKMHPNQTKKVFYEILEKIRILRSKDIPVRFVYIVNKLNYGEIIEAFKLNEELGTKLHLEVMDYNPGKGLNKIALNKNEKKILLRGLLKLKRKKEHKAENDHNLNDFINQVTYSALGLEKLKACYLGYFFSTINELGRVNYCFNYSKDLLMGDLNKKSFKDIWTSQRYNQLRNDLSKGKFLNTCQSCIKERGSNFKIRMYVEPIIGRVESELERSIL